jgi:hypothetical protein
MATCTYTGARIELRVHPRRMLIDSPRCILSYRRPAPIALYNHSPCVDKCASVTSPSRNDVCQGGLLPDGHPVSNPSFAVSYKIDFDF